MTRPILPPAETNTPTTDFTILTHDEHAIRHTILPLLHNYLPYSLVLYRRLQYHLLHPNAPHGKVITVFSSTVGSPEALLGLLPHPPRGGNPSNGVTGSDSKAPEWKPTSQDPGPDHSWLVSHVDVSRLTETAAFIFSSLELPVHPSGSTSTEPTAGRPPSFVHESRRALRNLLGHIRDQLIPTRPINVPEGWPFGKQMKAAEYKRDRILIGALHERMLEQLSMLAGEGMEDGITEGENGREVKIFRTDYPYLKWIVPRQSYEREISAGTSTSNGGDTELPPNLQFRSLTRVSEFQLTLDRTHIPRTVKTLASLPNIGVYPTASNESPEHEDKSKDEAETMPIAWAYLGYDSSLSSLHVEPEYRGKGIAQIVSKSLWREIMERYFTGARECAEVVQPAGWAHADVHEENGRSRRVMEKLAGEGEGRVAWNVAWTEVDVGESGT